jgi:hypothetical protein
MPDNPIREALFAALEADCADRATLSALADWSEENDDPDASAALRWLIRTGRRPGFNEHQFLFGKFFWSLEDPHPIMADPQALLPAILWHEIAGNDESKPVTSFKSFKTARLAYLALIAGWKRVRGAVPDPR